MESKNLLTLAITLTVGIILAGSLLMPVISDATETERTFENTGIYYMTDPPTAIHVEFLGDGAWEINDEPLDYSAVGSTNVIVTDTFFVRNIGQVRGQVDETWSAADLTIGNGAITGTATISGSSTSVSLTYEWIYVATNEKSEAIMKDGADVSYITASSEIIGAGITTLKDSTNTNRYFPFQVEVNDLAATVTPGVDTITVDNVVVNITPVEGYIGLYKFVSVTFDATYDDTVTPVVYNRVIVPAEVTAELANHMSSGEVAILNAIPVMIIVALVVMAVGALYLKRDD